MLHELYTAEGRTLPAIPWDVYPRPQLRRETWLNLNGTWEFTARDEESLPETYDKTILVPFCPESLLSGVKEHFPEGSFLYYRRGLSLPEGWAGRRVILHIGAADQVADVYVNGQHACHHEGGYEAFSADITDFLAELLAENGFTNGFIASADGFTRNLDRRDNTYRLNLFNLGEDGIDQAGILDYTGPKSLVFLRSYPLYDQALHRYYCYADGRIVTAMIDPADGMSKSSVANLVSYSENLGCGQLALAMMPIFVADDFAEDLLQELTEQDIYSIWFYGNQLRSNQPDISVTLEEPYTK
jgi:hypothetical protein